jgi:hypothetical protein
MAADELVAMLMKALQAQAARQRGYLSDAMARALAQVAIATVWESPSRGSAAWVPRLAPAGSWQPTGELRWYSEQSGQPVQLQQAWRCVKNGQVAWREVPLIIGQGVPQQQSS